MSKRHDVAPLRAIVAALAFVAVFAFFFVYPGHDPRPHELPVAVVGPATLAEALAQADEGDAFAVKRFATAQEARAAILDREVYGAFVADSGAVRLLTASAASPQVATLLQTFAAEAKLEPQLVELRPLADGDPRGASVNLTTLATTITSIIGAVMLYLFAPHLDGRRRLLALVAFAVLGGLTLMLVVDTGIGAFPGSFAALSAVAALAILAVAGTTAALLQRLGPPAVAVAFLLFLMLGVPSSGAASAPELLPSPWSWGGQLLPAGALATGLRNVAYFDGAQALTWLSVLVGWALAASVLTLLAKPRATAELVTLPTERRQLASVG